MQIPTELQGRYRIIKLLGKGGFGAVYLAEHMQLRGRQLAIKVSFKNSADAIEQFQFEASTLANLRHPNLPIVSDFFVEGGSQLFLVMDFIKGQDLTELIVGQQGAMDEAQAVGWMKEVCDAVAYLHEQTPPIIHRDIKPPNIKITPQNRAVLVDFGIAKRFTPGKRTAKIAKAFSPGFSPSEQYIGTTDARSDVYALGATLYCMLSGTVPPDAFHERLTKKTPLRPLRERNPNISPAVEEAVMRAMAMNPKFRYADARAFLRALDVIDASGGLRCPKCGTVNRPNTRFCVNDGTPLDVLPTAILRKTKTNSRPVSQPVAKQHARQGVDHLRAAANTQAALELEQAIRYDTQNAEYQHLLGIAYMRQGRLQEALTVAQKAISLDAANPEHQQLIGRIYTRLKRLPDAYAAYQNALACNPKIASIYSEFGQIALSLGNTKEAFDAFGVAANLEPNLAEPLIGAAQVLHDIKEYTQAQAVIDEAIRREPNNPNAYNFLGVIRYSLKDYHGALQAQERAFQLEPHNAAFAANIAADYLALNRRREAQQMAQQALRLDPMNYAAQKLLQKI